MPASPTTRAATPPPDLRLTTGSGGRRRWRESLHAVGSDTDHHDHLGILRHTNCGTIRIPTNIGCSALGTHTVRRRLANARTVAAATWSGVLDNGAGAMPSVMRPITNPGRTTSRCTPDPCSAS